MRKHTSLLAIILLVGALVGLAALPRLTARQGQSPSAALPAAHAFPVTLPDAQGGTVTIPARPARIISLAPAITETLFAIGAGDRVVAVSDFCNYPESVKTLPKAGGFQTPSVETITRYQPDLVLVNRGTQAMLLEQLRKLGVPVLTCDPQSVTEVATMIRQIGEATGAWEAAEGIAAGLERQRAALAAQQVAEGPRTLFLFGLEGGVFSAGPGSHIDDMIRLAGGRNIAPAGNAWPQLSMETVVAADPEVILVLAGHGTAQEPLTPQKALATLRADSKWVRVRAVKTGRVVVLDDDLVTRPGPRILEGVAAMRAGLVAPTGSAR